MTVSVVTRRSMAAWVVGLGSVGLGLVLGGAALAQYATVELAVKNKKFEPTEIMTDTGAYTDVIFGIFWLLGYQFSPRIADVGAAARRRMITSVRMVSPIMETPSKIPDATATKAVTEITVGIIAPSLRRRSANVIPSRMRVCAITDTKRVKPRMKSMVSA